MSNRDKTYTLIGILLALFLGALDQTIVSTALPKIVESLRGLNRYAWVATSYLLASTVLVPIYGKLADMYSRKMIELTSVALFLSGSFLCGIAGEFGSLPLLGDGMSQLIIFRAIQGLGGAGLFSMAFIIIADLFPPSERGRYQGLVGATFGIASVLGPWIGGLLTDYGGEIIPGVEGWRWVFYVNVPFGILAVWFILRRMPRLEPRGERAPLDLWSAVLLILGLAPLILGLQLDKQQYPWGGTTTVGLLLASGLSLVLFAVRSLRSPNPILDLSLFRDRVFSSANLATFFLGAAFLTTVIFLPLFMVNVLGVSATRAGVSLIPLSMGLVFGAVVSGQLVSRIGRYRSLMLVGGVILFIGIWLLSGMSPDTAYWQVTIYMVICGLGVGPSLPLYTLAIQNAVEVHQVGQATSASQFFRQIGGTVGAAIMGTVLATSLSASFAEVQAGDAGFSPQFSRSGGADIEGAILGQMEEQFVLLAEAVRGGDVQAISEALQDIPMPPAAKVGITLGAAGVRGNEEATSSFLEQLHQRMEGAAQEAAGQVTAQIRGAFAGAITLIFRSLLLVVAAGWLVTIFIPVLPLRTTNDIPNPVAAD